MSGEPEDWLVGLERAALAGAKPSPLSMFPEAFTKNTGLLLQQLLLVRRRGMHTQHLRLINRLFINQLNTDIVLKVSVLSERVCGMDTLPPRQEAIQKEPPAKRPERGPRKRHLPARSAQVFVQSENLLHIPTLQGKIVKVFKEQN